MLSCYRMITDVTVELRENGRIPAGVPVTGQLLELKNLDRLFDFLRRAWLLFPYAIP